MKKYKGLKNRSTNYYRKGHSRTASLKHRQKADRLSYKLSWYRKKSKNVNRVKSLIKKYKRR